MCRHYVEPAESLYAERGARYLSAKIMCDPEGAATMNRVTFILTNRCIVTVRYDESDAFKLFARRLSCSEADNVQPETVLVGLVNTIVNRAAHAIEMTDQRLEVRLKRWL
jgi:magnesium transporter